MSPEVIEARAEIQALIPRGPLENAYMASDVLLSFKSNSEIFTVAGLKPVTPFNTTYSDQTVEVLDHTEISGFFDYPETVLRTVPIFAQLYVDVIDAHCDKYNSDNAKKASIPLPWGLHAYAKNPSQIPPGFFALAGMHNHVGRDLALALLKSDVDDSYYEDYEKIDELIHNVATNLAPDFVIFGPPLRQPTVDLVVNGISRLRKKAWQDFEVLKACRSLPNGHLLAEQVMKKVDLETARGTANILRLGRLAGGAKGKAW